MRCFAASLATVTLSLPIAILDGLRIDAACHSKSSRRSDLTRGAARRVIAGICRALSTPQMLDGIIRGARMPDADSEGRYANLFRIGFNAFEFVFEFGQRFVGRSEVRMHTRIVTNPWHARQLLETLEESLREYERTHGVISAITPPDDPSPQ